MKSALRAIVIFFSVVFSIESEAASTLARVLSRANCLLPLAPCIGYICAGTEFNESVSWDPAGSNHNLWVTSLRLDYTKDCGLNLMQCILNGKKSEDIQKKSWRAWAGVVTPYAANILKPNSIRRTYWKVIGTHRELLDGWKNYYTNQTEATNCQITKW